jgi:hypothetical protein
MNSFGGSKSLVGTIIVDDATGSVNQMKRTVNKLGLAADSLPGWFESQHADQHHD